jgi:hypothetical protein
MFGFGKKKSGGKSGQDSFHDPAFPGNPQDGEHNDGPGDQAADKIPIVIGRDFSPEFKVKTLGYTVLIEGEVPEPYRFQYAPDSNSPDVMSPGVIPAGFCASVPCKANEVQNDTYLYLMTREGTGLGPEFQCTYSTPQNVLIDWTDDIDALWTEALGALEEHGDMSEVGLDLLDSDPLWLFGLASADTQRLLEKAARIPMLRCLGPRPTLGDWFSYLNADTKMDADYTWVVEAFSEVELPSPWVSFKGVGNMVCYLNEETQDTTWKHPFYDYFAQLMDHCKRATFEEHIKLRLNRMLWSFEADCATKIEEQQPLLSPKYIAIMAQIFKVDLQAEPVLVRTLKIFLKAFSQQYRLEEELSDQEIRWSVEIIENERKKIDLVAELKAHNEAYGLNEEGLTAEAVAAKEATDPIHPHVHAQVWCVECSKIATSYCIGCQDSYCEECFVRIHEKGQRRKHEFNFLSPCSLCQVFPAKLQCTYSFGLFCHECYARKHVKTLPKFLDLKPVKVDYRIPGGAEGWKIRDEVKPKKTAPAAALSSDWHSFFDPRGKEYYHNFATGEYGRRPTKKSQEEKRRSDHAEMHLTAIAEARGGRKLKLFSMLDREGVYKHKRRGPTPVLHSQGTRASDGGGDAY